MCSPCCSADSPAELQLVQDYSLANGADYAVPSNHWAKGGKGAVSLAEAVIKACEGESQFKFLYDLDKSLEEKIRIIATEMYGADGIELSEEARKQIETYTRQGQFRIERPAFASMVSDSAILLTSRRIRQLAHLHGQDRLVFVRRPQQEGCAHRVHPSHQPGQAVGRCQLRLPLGRRHVDHARFDHSTWILRHRLGPRDR